MDISLTEGIKFGKEDLCKDTGDQITDLQRGFETTISMGRGFGTKGLTEGISGIIDAGGESALGDLDLGIAGLKDKSNGMFSSIDTFKNDIASGSIVDGLNVNVGSIVDCLTGFDLSKFGIGDDGDTSKVNISSTNKILEETMSTMSTSIMNELSQLMGPAEKALMDGVDKLRNLLDIDVLDKLFQLTGCLQNCPGAESYQGTDTSINSYTVYCLTEQKEFIVYSLTPPVGPYVCPTDSNHVCDEELTKIKQKNIPSHLGIESKLSAIGLTINGEVDWESPALEGLEIPTKLIDNVNMVTEFKKDIENKVSLAKKFSPLPELPTLPKLPTLNNPIKDLDMSGKIAALF
jgi:hypothetical protein